MGPYRPFALLYWACTIPVRAYAGTFPTKTTIVRNLLVTPLNGEPAIPLDLAYTCPPTSGSTGQCADSTRGLFYSWSVSLSREVPIQRELANTHANRKRLCPIPKTPPNSIQSR